MDLLNELIRKLIRKLLPQPKARNVYAIFGHRTLAEWQPSNKGWFEDLFC